MGWIKREVNNLIKKHETNDPFELASLMNIMVVPWDFHKDINGLYKYDKRNKYIFYNNNLSSQMKVFVCAHELGHSVLHPKANTPFLRNKTLISIDRIEVEANRFAIELLLPDESLKEYQSSNLSIYEIADIYGIPREICSLKKIRI